MFVRDNGAVIELIRGDLRGYFLFSVPRDIGARQGKVHWKVRWVDQPEVGRF